MLSLIIFLLIIGIILILLEILVIPGTTVVGIGGFLMLASGIYLSYAEFDKNTGHIILALAGIAIVVAIFFSLRSSTWKKVSLDTEISGIANTYETDKIAIGDKGKTISRLAPMGKVMINNLIFEAKSISGFIDEKTEVEVIKIENNLITVKPLK